MSTTLIAPARTAQDTPDALDATSAPPDTSAAVESARAAHVEALAALGIARDAAVAAAQALAATQAGRQALLDGGTADDAALAEARSAVALAADRSDIAAGRVHLATQTAEAAEVALLRAQADHLTAQHAEAVRHQLAAAEAIDAAFRRLEAAIITYNSAGLHRALAAASAHQHNQNVTYAANANASLKGLEQREQPQTRVPHMQLPSVHAVLIGSPKMEEIVTRIKGSIAARVRSIIGLPADGGTGP